MHQIHEQTCQQERLSERECPGALRLCNWRLCSQSEGPHPAAAISLLNDHLKEGKKKSDSNDKDNFLSVLFYLLIPASG